MNKNRLSLWTKISTKLLTSCIFTLMLTTTGLAGYTPPKNPSRPNIPLGSGGTRTGGCSATSPAGLTALAPISHIGKTVSQQPTFAWFVPDTKSYKMEFSVYEYSDNGKGKEIKSFEFSSQPRIMKFSIPKDEFNFSVGKKFLWQIALLCDPNNPAKDLYTEAVIEVVSMPNNLINQIAVTKTSIEKSKIYAREGFWYDAFAEALKSPQNKQNHLTFYLTLLEQLGNLEAKAAINSPPLLKKTLQNQVLQLENIVKTEQQK